MKISLEACGRVASEKISSIVCLSPFRDKYLLEMLNDGGISILPRYSTTLFRKRLALLSGYIRLVSMSNL